MSYLHYAHFYRKLINYLFPNLSVSLYRPIIKLFGVYCFYYSILSMTDFISRCITFTLRMTCSSSSLSSNDMINNCTMFNTSFISSRMFSGLFFSSIPCLLFSIFSFDCYALFGKCYNYMFLFLMYHR